MKRWLLRLMLWMTGYAKEKRQLNVVKLRVGETPRQLEIEMWHHKYNDGSERQMFQLSVWYPYILTNDKFEFTTLPDAMAEGLLVEQFLGKPIP